jgi:hypothetical protein
MGFLTTVFGRWHSQSQTSEFRTGNPLIRFNDQIGFVEPLNDGALFTQRQVEALREWSTTGLAPYETSLQDDGRILVQLKHN